MTTESKPAYSPGLAGVIAGETEICWVDPNAGDDARESGAVGWFGFSGHKFFLLRSAPYS